MIRGLIVSVVCLAFLLAGCSSGNSNAPGGTRNGNADTPKVSTPTGAQASTSAPKAHIGSQIPVQLNGDQYGTGIQLYTVFAPTGNLTVRVVVEQQEGSGYLGNFTALTDAGTRLDPVFTGGQYLSIQGQLVKGEVRRGDLEFSVPAGQRVTKVLVDQAYNVVAEWDL